MRWGEGWSIDYNRVNEREKVVRRGKVMHVDVAMSRRGSATLFLACP